MFFIRKFLSSFEESIYKTRKGDKPSETETLRELVKSSTIGVITSNETKFEAFKEALNLFGIKKVKRINLEGLNFADLQPFPARAKVEAAKHLSDADLFLARGRLSLPGSGACTLLADREGHIISAATAPPHHITGAPLQLAVFTDTVNLLLRLGFKPLPHRGITEKTLSVYSTLSLFDVFGLISLQKWKALQKAVKALKPQTVLIIGGYLDGLFFVRFLKQELPTAGVYLFDISPEVYRLFKLEGIDIKKPEPREYDLIFDLTGFGGLSELPFRGKRVVVELPGEGFEKKLQIPGEVYFLKPLFKGSAGTMSLTVKSVREASKEAEENFDIFYCVPNLINLESFLFNFKNPKGFAFLSHHYPALTASAPLSKAPTVENLDRILKSAASRWRFTLSF